jgi:hypothetical protein
MCEIYHLCWQHTVCEPRPNLLFQTCSYLDSECPYNFKTVVYVLSLADETTPN